NNCHTYPTLHWMALNFLSVPGVSDHLTPMSTAVEHVFSQERQLLHFTHN
ncbi:hypothetical protein PAXRUDRAFT_158868, partial [Paxillus rubicundulus Ve08.2h10]